MGAIYWKWGQNSTVVTGCLCSLPFKFKKLGGGFMQIVNQTVPRALKALGYQEEQVKAADAPLCMTCGTKTRPASSCYLCEGCGSTSGCS